MVTYLEWATAASDSSMGETVLQEQNNKYSTETKVMFETTNAMFDVISRFYLKNGAVVRYDAPRRTGRTSSFVRAIINKMYKSEKWQFLTTLANHTEMMNFQTTLTYYNGTTLPSGSSPISVSWESTFYKGFEGRRQFAIHHYRLGFKGQEPFIFVDVDFIRDNTPERLSAILETLKEDDPPKMRVQMQYADEFPQHPTSVPDSFWILLVQEVPYAEVYIVGLDDNDFHISAFHSKYCYFKSILNTVPTQRQLETLQGGFHAGKALYFYTIRMEETVRKFKKFLIDNGLAVTFHCVVDNPELVKWMSINIYNFSNRDSTVMDTLASAIQNMNVTTTTMNTPLTEMDPLELLANDIQRLQLVAPPNQ